MTAYSAARLWYFAAVGSVPAAASLNGVLAGLAIAYGANPATRTDVGHLRSIYRAITGVPSVGFTENAVLRQIYRALGGSASAMPLGTAQLYGAIAAIAPPIVPPEPTDFDAAAYIVLFSRGF